MPNRAQLAESQTPTLSDASALVMPGPRQPRGGTRGRRWQRL